MAKKQFITTTEAVRKLKVQPVTIKAWVKCGRLKGIIKRKNKRESALVDKASLNDAFKVKCLWCGKTFKAKHPEQAKYCCRVHKDAFIYSQKKKGAWAYKKWRRIK